MQRLIISSAHLQALTSRTALLHLGKIKVVELALLQRDADRPLLADTHDVGYLFFYVA